MRIIDKTGKSKGPYLSIVEATYIDDYRLLVTFNDGISRIVDFGEFLSACPHPDVKKYLDIRNFKAFHIEYGDLMWGDFDMIFPITDLHRGTIEYIPPRRTDRATKSANRRSKLIPSARLKSPKPKRTAHAT